ncbi:MAG: extracellular solute-binding protein [bacterium]
MKFKKVLTLGLVATSALTLSACGGSSSSDGIVFWHTMGEANMAVLDSIIADFNKIYPEIKVTHAAQGGFDELKEKVSTAIQGGNEPNLTYVYPDHVASYLSQQVVVDLDTFIDNTNKISSTGIATTDAFEDDIIGYSTDEQNDFIEGYWNEGKVYNSLGTMFSLPFSKSTEAMYYNKTAFDANGWSVPTTWDEMWALCATIKATEGYEDVTPFGYDSENNMFITLLEQNNLPYTSNDASNRYTFNTTEAVSLFTDIQKYYNAGYFTTKALSEDEYTSTQFKAQDLLMTIGSTGGASYNLPDKDGDGEYVFEYGVTAIPQESNPMLGDAVSKVIQQGPSLAMLNDGSEKNMQTWLFMKYLLSPEVSATYSMSTGYSPVRKSSLELDYFQEFVGLGTIQANSLQVAIEQNDSYYTSLAFNGSSNARVQVGFIMEKICLSGTDVAQAFKDAIDELK